MAKCNKFLCALFSRVIFSGVVTFSYGELCLFQKILVPLDGSDHSLKALEEAAQLAKISSGKMTLLNVYSLQHIISMSGLPEVGHPTKSILIHPEVDKVAEAASKYGFRVLSARAIRDDRALYCTLSKSTIHGSSSIGSHYI